jgi:uncharacterized protein (DUF58 family)
VTPRGRRVLAFAVAAYVVAWAFGSQPLYPLAVGLVVAILIATAWVRLVGRSTAPVELRRTAGRGRDILEGDDVAVDLELALETRLPPPSVTVVEEIERIGERETPLVRAGRRLRGRYLLGSLPRGRYAFRSARAVVEDPFGLYRLELPLGRGGALLVYPRLVDLDRLFFESGGTATGGRRLLLRRPSGFDFHSVRDYEQGESLRKVHWPSTARRGHLMVRELEDSPRDEVAVVVDANETAVVGAPPDSSFDMQVRAAGSILQSCVRRGRRAVLVANAPHVEHARLHSSDGDWHRTLELLAALEPCAARPLVDLLARDGGDATRALELVVVTSTLTPPLLDRLVQRALARRNVSLVYVDAPSFGRGRRASREGGLLRAHAAGIPLAVLRSGDNLAEKLGAIALEKKAHA